MSSQDSNTQQITKKEIIAISSEKENFFILTTSSIDNSIIAQFIKKVKSFLESK